MLVRECGMVTLLPGIAEKAILLRAENVLIPTLKILPIVLQFSPMTMTNITHANLATDR